MFTQQKQRAENAESEQCGKPAVPQKLANELITVRKQLDLDGLFFAETRVDCACAADNHLAKPVRFQQTVFRDRCFSADDFPREAL